VEPNEEYVEEEAEEVDDLEGLVGGWLGPWLTWMVTRDGREFNRSNGRAWLGGKRLNSGAIEGRQSDRLIDHRADLLPLSSYGVVHD
jgi:hypothetical protein